MRYGSLFTGIGGFDLGLDRAGLECAWQVEIDPKCREVLARHWPDATRYEDVTQVGDDLEPVDLICGGFPCQDLSVAGRRAGLAGERSGLWHEFHRILASRRPRWVVIENVPGLLSSNQGRDFAVVLRGLVELGYGVAWRVLDSQYFGVAQRRRRVFIVGSLGDGRAAEVLFEREGHPGDTPPRRQTGAGVAGTIRSGSDSPGAHGKANGTDRGPFAYTIQSNDGGAHKRKDRPEGGLYVAETETALTVGSTDLTAVVGSQTAHHGRNNPDSQPFVNAFNGYTGGPDDNDARGGHKVAAPIKAAPPSQRGGGSYPTPGEFVFGLMPRRGTFEEGDLSPTMNAGNGGFGAPGVAWHENKQGELSPGETAKALRSGASHSYQGVGVRRLTPRECERLQSFPDDWTGGQSDSTRYRQLGNAVTVNVAEWLGRRLLESMR